MYISTQFQSGALTDQPHQLLKSSTLLDSTNTSICWGRVVLVIMHITALEKKMSKLPKKYNEKLQKVQKQLATLNKSRTALISQANFQTFYIKMTGQDTLPQKCPELVMTLSVMNIGTGNVTKRGIYPQNVH